jgi:spore germination cell wall hydrolase CwlJ-like protein
VQKQTQARAHARALVGAVAIGSTLSLALSGAYLAGGAARAHAADVPVELQAASLEAFTDNSPAGPGQGPAFAAALKQGHRNGLQADGLQRVSLNVAPAAQRVAGMALSGRDLECLTTAVYYEARGEGSAGQAAVAQVVLNRVRHPAFPKTVCGVVFQGSKGRGCQFSFACNGAMRAPKNGAAWSRARDVATRAMNGSLLTAVGNATHFHATRVAPGWRGLVRVAQVGAHVFYRFGGKAGRPSVFKTPTILASRDEAPKPAYKVLRPSSLEGGELMLASTEPTPVASAPAAKPADPAMAKPADAAKPAPAADAKPAETAVQAASAS